MQRTVALVKPDAFHANGTIYSLIRAQGLVAFRSTVLRLTHAEAAGFYKVHEERPFFEELCTFMSSGNIRVFLLEGEDAIARWRTMMGPTFSPPADTIRGKFGTSTMHNAVHGSDSPESAAFETAYLFAGYHLAP